MGPLGAMAPAALTKKAGMSVMCLSRSLPSVPAQDEGSVLAVENQATAQSSLWSGPVTAPPTVLISRRFKWKTRHHLL